MHRCAKKTDTPTGRYRDTASGKAVDVEPFPTGGKAASENVEAYAGSLAVKLLLRFQKQARRTLSHARTCNDVCKHHKTSGPCKPPSTAGRQQEQLL
eukprot:4878452-Prymnesium_polylepis.1